MGLPPSTNNGGSFIDSYTLMRDSGNLTSGINIIVNGYNGVDQVYTVDGLVAGVIYRFAYFASNSFGISVASNILTIAATNLPNKPENI